MLQEGQIVLKQAVSWRLAQHLAQTRCPVFAEGRRGIQGRQWSRERNVPCMRHRGQLEVSLGPQPHCRAVQSSWRELRARRRTRRADVLEAKGRGISRSFISKVHYS